MMKTILFLLALAAVSSAETPTPSPQPPETLTLPQCLELALQQSPSLLKAQQDLRRSHGLIVEARAAALPQIVATGQYSRLDKDSVENFTNDNQVDPWNAKIEVTQLLYSGGKVHAALRAARLTEQIARLSFQRAVADTLLAVYKSFYQTLLHQAQVEVREQSVRLLQQQLQDAQLRFEVGAVPQFNVLRAQVELANAKPPLIRAQNNLRLSREVLVKLLALEDRDSRNEFTSLRFIGELSCEPRACALTNALAQALSCRPELGQARQQIQLAQENLRAVSANDKPQISLFANYGVRDTTFGNEMDDTIQGWAVGARASWALFDGLQTHGKQIQSRAQLAQAEVDFADARRGVELEVRQAYSDYRQAIELLDAQKKTVEQATESLRLAEARFRAGAGTQLEVLSAQTALTEARSNEIQSQYEYNVALAALDRATGVTVKSSP